VKYSRLYISAVSDFYACNLEDDISPEFRITPYLVDEQQRRAFFLSALDYRCGTGASDAENESL
ncbi:MAG: hypothetical protein ACI3Y8_07365, partial [Candidatus Cryptobacteroides sp.]